MGNPSVVFPDATAVSITYVKAKLTAVGSAALVKPRRPSNWNGTNPAELVTIHRSGGVRMNLVTDEAQLTISSYAPTEEEAHDLAQYVRAFLLGMTGHTASGTTVYRVQEFSGPALLPDPTADCPRYFQQMSVAMRGTSIPVSD